MNKGIIYIDYDEALNIYGKMIDASDGGFEGGWIDVMTGRRRAQRRIGCLDNKCLLNKIS